MVELVKISASQTRAIMDTCKAIRQLLDYWETYLNKKLRYNTTDMVLRIHSNESYLSYKKSGAAQEGISTWEKNIMTRHSMDPY